MLAGGQLGGAIKLTGGRHPEDIRVWPRTDLGTEVLVRPDTERRVLQAAPQRAESRSSSPAVPPAPRRAARVWRAAGVALMITMAVLLLLALAFPHWERFADKAMGARAIFYPMSALIVPVVWGLRRRKHPESQFPWDVHAFLVAPFVIDLTGNALNLFDAVGWFDDACHFGNWALLGLALGAVLLGSSRSAINYESANSQSLRPRSPADAELPFASASWLTIAVCGGLGAIAAISWEFGEYLTFVRNTPETVDLYEDTMGDLMLGTAGAALAGVITALRVRFARVKGLAAGS